MSSTVTLSCPEGVYVCKCGFGGYSYDSNVDDSRSTSWTMRNCAEGHSDAFKYVFDAANDSNWLECPKCGNTIKLTKDDDLSGWEQRDDGWKQDAFWTNSKATFKTRNEKGRYVGYNPAWDLLYLVKKHMGGENMLIRGTSARTFTCTLRDIMMPLSYTECIKLFALLGIRYSEAKVEDVATAGKLNFQGLTRYERKVTPRDSSEVTGRLDRKWTWLNEAIKQARKRTHIEKLRDRVVCDPELADAYRMISMDESPAIKCVSSTISHMASKEKEWIYNPSGKGKRLYSMSKINAYLDSHMLHYTKKNGEKVLIDLADEVGEMPKLVDYDPGKLIAQKCHQYNDVYNKQGKLKSEEMGEFDHNDDLEIALRDIADDRWEPSKSKICSTYDKMLLADRAIKFDDTDVSTDFFSPDEDDQYYEWYPKAQLAA